MTHFTALGFDVPDERAMARLVERALDEGTVTRTRQGWRSTWHAGGGAMLTVHVRRREVACVLPWLQVEAPLQLANPVVALDPDCPHCSVVCAWVPGHYPLAFQAPNVGDWLDTTPPQFLEVGLAAVGDREVSVHPSEEAFRAYQTAHLGDARFAPESFISSGLFDEGGESPSPRAEGLLAGVVEAAELRRNLAGTDFVWARLRTFGTTVEACLDREDLADVPSRGDIVLGFFWLVGPVLTAPPSRNWLDRLRGR